MDLHLTSDRPTESEIAAIDSVLGAPHSGWDGGKREVSTDGRVALRQSPPRDQLLPAFHALNSRIGWISLGAINHIAVRMNLPPAEIYGVASFYGMFSLGPRPPIVVRVCDDIACLARGADSLCASLEKSWGPAGSSTASQNKTWLRSACLGLCERAPAALISCSCDSPRELTLAPATVSAIDQSISTLSANSSQPASETSPLSSVLQSPSQTKLLSRIARSVPTTLDAYRSSGGYSALAKAISLGPQKIVAEVIASKLMGRGGAAFPTGKKWEALLNDNSGRPHYLICNADESEPGTFKDRILMEGDPFAILEGMTIAAIATGAKQGYLYIRGEYPHAAAQMESAISATRVANLLGNSILGSAHSFDIAIRHGAGAYICGEETALFNSIEGYRGEPRNKPPFPTQSGLFRQPTVVNNVETLANIPLILQEGGAAYARTGTEHSTGTRLFCLSGHIAHPGVYEVPFGTTLRSLIALAGGVSGTGILQAILLGGAAGTFLSPAELDTPLSFEHTRAINASLGSGVVMLFDDSVRLEKILLRIAEFFREETCGQCVPCRVGTIRQEELLHRLATASHNSNAASHSATKSHDLTTLNEIAQAMRDASICGLGQTASSAILSAINRWSLFP